AGGGTGVDGDCSDPSSGNQAPPMAAASRQGAGAAQRCMLIEIEGPSGAGKSSLIRRLCTAAQFAHRPVVNLADREKVTTDPGWRVGDLMRGIGQRLDPLEAVFLYCARV